MNTKTYRIVSVLAAFVALLAYFLLPALLCSVGLLSQEAAGWSGFWALRTLIACIVTSILCVIFPKKIVAVMCILSLVVHLVFLVGLHPK